MLGFPLSRHALRLLPWTVFVLVAGCSALVDPGTDRCSDHAGCPTGLLCEEGICVVGSECTAGMEVCNQIDDDCDDIIDEDIPDVPDVCNGFDDDCDGRTDEDAPDVPDVCNGFDDDCDGTTDEGTTEICNGLDDDCDQVVDNGDNLCPPGQACLNGCVVPTCANDPSLACAEGEYCDTSLDAPICKDLPPATCTTDDQCESSEVCSRDTRICVPRTELGEDCASDASCIRGDFCAELNPVGRTGRTCTHTCCNDSDCPSGSECANRWQGVRLCVPRGGTGRPLGESCSAMGDCISGFCNDDGACAAVCSTDGDCQGGQVCAFRRVTDDIRIRGCADPTGSGERFEWCIAGTCIHNYCSNLGCLEGCDGPNQCGDEACQTVFLGEDFISFCLERESGEQPVGSSCTANRECDTLHCQDGKCVHTCCTSAQCASGQECRPIRLGENSPTFCMDV